MPMALAEAFVALSTLHSVLRPHTTNLYTTLTLYKTLHDPDQIPI